MKQRSRLLGSRERVEALPAGVDTADAFLRGLTRGGLVQDNFDDLHAVIAPDWLPLLVTPSFPSYPSGHSPQSGAVATVLTDLFGLQPFTDTTHRDHGLTPPQTPRTFTAFDEAAAEAALSRLYAGIHDPFDNDIGLAQGRCIGQIIFDRLAFRR